MDFLSIIKLIGTTIVTVGTAGGIIMAVAKGIASRTADVLAAKIQAENQVKIDKSLEEWKFQLENKGHVMKSSFDVEFTIYQDLCGTFFSMISSVHWLFPSGLDRAPAQGNWEKICNERYTTAQKEYNTAVTMLGSKAPFITKEIHDKLYSIIKLAAMQINDYAFCEPFTTDKSSSGIKEIERQGYCRTEEIDKKWTVLLDDLRKYLTSLKK